MEVSSHSTNANAAEPTNENATDLPSLEILLIGLRLKEIEMRETLIDHLREIDHHRLWRQGHHKSFAEFCERRLGYDLHQVRALLIEMDLIIPSHRLVSRDPEIQQRIEHLREWRKNESRRQKIAAYRIFNNRSLLRLAQLNPITLVELGAVPGIGPKKLAEYGESILNQLAQLGHMVAGSSQVLKWPGGGDFSSAHSPVHAPSV